MPSEITLLVDVDVGALWPWTNVALVEAFNGLLAGLSQGNVMMCTMPSRSGAEAHEQAETR